jgi:hypothetical protein
MRIVFAGKEITAAKTIEKTIAEVGLLNNSSTFIIYRLKGGIYRSFD